MKNAAWLLPLLAAFPFCFVGCRSPAIAEPAPASSAEHHYAPSPHRIVGYILEIDEARGLAIVDLTADPLPSELHEGSTLTVRTHDLQPTAHLSASRFLRGRTLGATIVTGLPAVGEEVIMAKP